MSDELNAAFTVLMGYSFHDDSPAASWFRANEDRIAGVYKLTTSGRYSQIERPEYAAVISDIRQLGELDEDRINQCLAILGLPTSRLIADHELAGIAMKHERSTERLEGPIWRLRFPKYQPQAPVVQPQAVRCLMPGEEFHLIDLLTGVAVLPEGVKDFERRSMLGTWVPLEDLNDQGNFKAIRDRDYVYRIAPPKLKPLPSEVSNLLVEVPELKTRLIELGYDLRQPVRT